MAGRTPCLPLNGCHPIGSSAVCPPCRSPVRQPHRIRTPIAKIAAGLESLAGTYKATLGRGLADLARSANPTLALTTAPLGSHFCEQVTHIWSIRLRHPHIRPPDHARIPGAEIAAGFNILDDWGPIAFRRDRFLQPQPALVIPVDYSTYARPPPVTALFVARSRCHVAIWVAAYGAYRTERALEGCLNHRCPSQQTHEVCTIDEQARRAP
ncbi:hypothetical protein RSOLAG22IIIB_08838 [Rhizoctonia solani]|uniref:Uncharacterized protein n=1 Tax=Rhizoctonia solani TaxID=456999 RepID=A0A0K6FUX7_9AGAM|nr:hypothetical protein RSOLAG22IIIB_08838 [Rhizoctonia solani]